MSLVFQEKNGKLVSPVPAGWQYALLAFLIIFPLVLWAALQFIEAKEVVASLFLVGVAVFSLAFFRPGLILLLLFVLFEPLGVRFIPADFVLYFRLIPEVIIVALFIAGLVKLIVQYKQENRTISIPALFPLFLFVGVALLSALVNRIDVLEAAVGLRQLLRFMAIYLALLMYGLPRKTILTVVGVVAGVTVFQSVIGLAQATFGAQIDNFLATGRDLSVGRFQVAREFWQNRVPGERVFGTLGRYDQLGTFLSLICVASLGFAYEAKAKYRTIALSVLVLALPALLLTYSRASWFGFLLGLILIAIIIKRDRRVVAGLLILVLALVSYIGFKEIEVKRLIDEPQVSPINRLLEAFSEKRIRGEYSGKGRLYFIVETPPAILKNAPLLGVGPGQFGGGAVVLLHNTKAYDELNIPFGVYGHEGTIDNNWMSVFAETGLLGVTAFMAIFVTLFIYAKRILKDEKASWLSRSLALGLMAATVSFCFQAFLATYFEVRTIAPFYWTLAALTILAYQQDKLETQDESITG